MLYDKFGNIWEYTLYYAPTDSKMVNLLFTLELQLTAPAAN